MITCRGECGIKQPSEEAALQAGWSHLEISNGWRCGACGRLLREAGSIVGTDGVTEDRLAPDSRGALPKETASTILQPTVKRQP